MIIKETIRDNEFVGIWWYTDSGEVWGLLKPTEEAVPYEGYLQYDAIKNHISEWRKVLNAFCKNQDEINSYISKGYRSLERGRVLFDIANQCYKVTCSKNLVNDNRFKSKIISYYGLDFNKVVFEALDHYCKIAYTGNPALDRFLDEF